MGKKKIKIYITDYIRRQIQLDPGLVGENWDIELLQEPDEKKLFPKIRDADALVVDKTPITRFSIEKLEHCKVIIRLGVGYDNVDLKAAGEKGIPVCNIPDFCTEEVADHAVSLLLNLSRNTASYHTGLLQKQAAGWNPLENASTCRLRGKTIGIAGLGRIGKEVARRCAPFGLRILFVDPAVSAQEGKKVSAEKIGSLEELAGQSDIVSFHVPLNPQTHYLANGHFFQSLKKGAFLINTSRGPVVELAALFEALKNGTVAKAGLDVLEQEPISFEQPLFKEWLEKPELQRRLVLTPHAAFFSPESTEDVKIKAMQEIKRVLDGNEPLNCVNRQFLEKKGTQ